MSDVQQKRGLEAEPYDLMADGCTSNPMRTWHVRPVSRSPSPHPSPLRRGRILHCLSADATAVFARPTFEKLAPLARCSLSLRERARVGNQAADSNTDSQDGRHCRTLPVLLQNWRCSMMNINKPRYRKR